MGLSGRFRGVRSRQGFTTTELLGAVAVMVILFALLVPNLFVHQLDLRQSELDAKAETMYVAVQNELAKLKAHGRSYAYELGPGRNVVVNADDAGLGTPRDLDPEYVGGRLKQDIRYLGQGVGDLRCVEVASLLVSADVVDASLVSNHWVIEYDPSQGTVYSVFYSEDTDVESEYVSDWQRYDGYRVRSDGRGGGRRDAGAHVGYYGGNGVETSAETYRLAPAIMVENGERLALHISCRGPAGVSDIEFTLRMRDSEGHSFTRRYKAIEVTHFGRLHTLEVVLDDLSGESSRFWNLYDGFNVQNYNFDNSGSAQALVPGTPLTVEVLAQSKSNRLVEAGVGSARTNSLFANDSTVSEAHVACARHLQNLEAAGSHVSASVTKALQVSDVNMGPSSDFADMYGRSYVGGVAEPNGHGGSRARFVPIANPSLASYDGAGHAVRGLSSKGEGDVGMFASLHDGMSVTGVRLVGANVESTSGSAGALAGRSVGSNVRVSGCESYLSADDVRGLTDESRWVSGARSGGLVGEVAGGSVTIDGSLAATVASGGHVGGLVGQVSGGSCSLASSYADSYLYGEVVGGLATGDVSGVSSCYAAGFSHATGSSAGLVTGRVGNASRSYSIISLDQGSGAHVALFGEAGEADRCRYFAASTSGSELSGTSAIGEDTSAALAEYLGGAFTAVTAGQTTPYNLRGQALDSYDWPRLSALRHRGDWKAEFAAGGLVYFERYSDGRFGFWGAGVDSLSDEVVVGDGYGVAYRVTDTVPSPLRVSVDGTSYELGSVYHEVVRDGVTYRIYSLPVEAMCADMRPGFYHDVRVFGAGGSFTAWAANLSFAKTQVEAERSGDDVVMPGVDELGRVSVRSARQLHELSRRYPSISEDTADVTFSQDVAVDYSSYDWDGFTSFGHVSSQAPIDDDDGFVALYDGHCNLVSGLSVVGTDHARVGLFGLVSGVVRNVVLARDVTGTDVEGGRVRRETLLGTNQSLAMGVLAGRNEGVVENCAVSGYRVETRNGTMYAYANSVLHVGGLVGENAGLVRDCSVTFPEMRVSSLYAQVGVGGLVGTNEDWGSVDGCYAVGHLSVIDSRGGLVNVSGLVGDNDGSVKGSYCATSIVAAGDASSSHAFCPRGGSVSDCFYLDSGTYRYLGATRSYSSNAAATDGLPMLYSELAASGEGVGRSEFHAGTEGDSYPFPGVVSDGDGTLVHYGDWPEGVSLGDFGVFYWEVEEGGSNSGCHLTYVSAAGEVGSTLCGAHDDGGAITRYGYGYYVSDDGVGSAGVSASRLDMSISGGGPGEFDEGVAADLRREMSSLSGGGYTFYPYETGLGGAHVSLDAGEGPWGSITVRVADRQATFEVAPFFANAIRRVGGDSVTLVGADGRESDYGAELGSDENAFEVRSARQLAYINWNYKTHDCDTLVYGEQGREQVSTGIGNYRDFPYLQFATVLTKGTQTRAAVEALRPSMQWVQSHDVLGDGTAHVPIAGMATSSPVSDGNYENIVYAWFGGGYDGQSYKVENVDVVSCAYTVGLFGVTAGADIRNVIMFSDDGSVVRRETAGLANVEVADHTLDFDYGPGAYSVGGLVGIAYDYSAETGTGEVSNCAIAGYSVVDESTNRQGAGTANVGGLIGFANVNLRRCSSAADLYIDSTHAHGHMAWGSFYRIGGLVGSAGAPGNGNSGGSVPLHVSDCYTGGSIRVSERLLHEDPTMFDGNGFARSSSGTNGGRNASLFVSGIVGGSYAPNISNFSNCNSNSPDGTAYIERCYTYTDLPDVEGTIRAVSFIANQADRYSRDTKIYVTNCHYLQDPSSVDHPRRSVGASWPDYFFSSSATTAVPKAPTAAELAAIRAGDETLRRKFETLVPSDAQWEEMLLGDLSFLRTYLNSQGTSHAGVPSRAEQHASSQGEFASSGTSLLGGGVWDWVTTVDDAGAAIDGRYSFSSDPSQTGKNYPFPTVITEGSAHVHYGAWPKGDMWWERGRDSMDILSDMQVDGWARKEFLLLSARGPEAVPDVSVEGAAATVGAMRWDGSRGGWVVTLVARRTGFVSVEADVNGVSASFVVEVRAVGNVVVAPSERLLFVDEPFRLSLSLSTSSGTWSGSGTFGLSCASPSFEDVVEVSGSGGSWSVTALEPGVRVPMRATFSLDYHGTPVASSNLLYLDVAGKVGLSSTDGAMETPRASGGTHEGVEARVVRLPDGWQAAVLASGGASASGLVSSAALSVVGEDGRPVEGYSAYLGTDTSVIGDVEVRRVHVVRRGIAEVVPLRLSARLTDAVTGAVYTMSVPVEAVEGHVVSFDGGGATSGSMPDVVCDGQLRLPACGFSWEGHVFDHWEVGGESHAVGDVVSATSDTVAIARWREIVCVVSFDGNGGDGQMGPVEVGPGEIFLVPGCAFSRWQHRFVGWNTMADGSGRAFAPTDEVPSSELGEGVTLFAQWEEKGRLTLLDGTTSVWSGIADGTALDGYVRPAHDGFELVGWYAERDMSSEECVDASGAGMGSVMGPDGSFDVVGDVTLHALWRGTVYVASDGFDVPVGETRDHVVLDAMSVGTHKALRYVAGGSVGGLDVTVADVHAMAADGSDLGLCLTSVPADCVWTAEWRRARDGVDYFSLEAKGVSTGKRYLRGNNNTVELTNTLMYGNSYSNKQMWDYGRNAAGALMCENQKVETQTLKCVGWESSKWAQTSVSNRVALLELTEDAYLFDVV